MGQKLRISCWAFVWLALLLLVLPLRWIVCAICAAAFHECCHILAIRLCGGRINGFRVGQSGAVLNTDMLTRHQELLCALAGPAGSALLVLTANRFPRLAVCALFHGIYNLLPVYPMDGGRAIRCAAALFLGEERAECFCLWVTRCFCIALFASAIYVSFTCHMGILPVLLTGMLLIRINYRNYPCKERLWRVQ